MAARGRVLRSSFPCAACVLVLVLAAACATLRPRPPAPPVSIVLLPDEQGRTGAITVSSAEGQIVLSNPRQSMTVSAGGAQEEPVVMTEEEVQVLAGPALEALPKPPEHFTFYFEHDSTGLTEASRAKLQEVLQAIRERVAVEISVVGHTDTMGTNPYNYQLSFERARAVAALFVAEGVNPSILEIASHGENNPLIPTGDQTPEPRNRRVEATVR